MKNKILIMTIVIFVSSCALSGVKNHREFKERWQDSKKHSRVSWWYVGETDNAYFIKERWVLMSYEYEIPKSKITLNGILKMSPCSECEGVTLFDSNVKFSH